MEHIPWWRIKFGLEEAHKIIDSMVKEKISQGTVTMELEAEIAKKLNVPYVIATTSGSIALLMTLMSLGIKHGDELIVPNRTFIATSHAGLILGAKIVLVDTEPDIPVMDVSKIREKITSRTRAIIPVHLNGRSVNMDEVNNIAREYGLYVVEDACQAFYSRNPQGFLGTRSDIGCFSMGVTKLVSTGQGGIIVTRNQELYEKCRLIRNHGVVDILNDSYNQPGFNFKFTDLLASMGLVQLSRLADKVAYVNKIYRTYEQGLADCNFVKLIPVKISHGEIPLYAEVLCNNREKLMDDLKTYGIETRRFLPDLCLSPYLENTGDFPN